MSGSDQQPKNDRVGKDYQQGPNPAPGGEVDLSDDAVPPYEGRTDGSGDPSGSAQSVKRQAPKGDYSGGGTTSPAQESPAREDEVFEGEPKSPKGVGESLSTSGEDVADRDGKERGRQDTGTDEKGRPEGTSDGRDQTSI